MQAGTITNAQARVISARDSGVVVHFRWREADAAGMGELFQVLRLRGGRVVDMEDHSNHRSAVRALGVGV